MARSTLCALLLMYLVMSQHCLVAAQTISHAKSLREEKQKLESQLKDVRSKESMLISRLADLKKQMLPIEESTHTHSPEVKATANTKGEDKASSEKVFLGHSISWWIWASGLVGFFLLGFPWFEGSLFREGFQPFIYIHAVTQWSPLFLLLPWLSGWASCEDGLPWLQHLIYLVSAIGASNFTGHPRKTIFGIGLNPDSLGIPILGLSGTLMARFYHYIITLLYMFDTYGDSMNVAIAWSCEWNYAWLMLVVLLGSQVLQCIAGYFAITRSPLEGAALVLFGFLPDAFTTGNQEAVKFAVYLGITRMLTENLPQAALSLWFAHEIKPSCFVYVNVAISLAVASKTFFSSLSRACANDYTRVEANN